MADLYISYFASVELGCASKPTHSEVVTTSETSAAGTPNDNGEAVAMLFSEAAHWVTVGFITIVPGEDEEPDEEVPPEATATNGFYLPAKWAYPVRLAQGNVLAAITV